MQTVTTALSKAIPGGSPTATEPRPLSQTSVNHVFDRLKGQLGAKIADLWAGVTPTSLVEEEWARGLAGFVKHELERGLDACSTRIFAPTLGEFKQLCRPCLNPEWAWYEAQDGLKQREQGELGDWTHPAVYFAAVEMPLEVRSGDWQRHRTRWTRLLQLELAKGWGRKVPVPAMRIGHAVKTGPPPADVRSNIERLLAEARAHAAQKKADKAAAEEGGE